MKRFLVFLLMVLFMLSSSATACGKIENDLNRYLYAICNDVSVREDCNPKSRILGTLDEREIVFGLEFMVGADGKNWVLAETQVGVGYISQDDLTYVVEELSPVLTFLELRDEACIMSKPSCKGQIYDIIPAGMYVSVKAFYPTRGEGTWAAITISEGIDGYISIKSLYYLDGSKFHNLPEFVEVKRDTWTYQEDLNSFERNQLVYHGEILKVNYYLKLSDGTVLASCMNSSYENVGLVLIKDLSKK